MSMLVPRCVAGGALVAGLMLACSGCYTVRYHTKAPVAAPPVSSWNHIFLWGLAGSATVDVRATCPRGMAKLETKRTFGNLLVSLLTIGIYSPSSVTVWCSDGRGPSRPKGPTPATGPGGASAPEETPSVFEQGAQLPTQGGGRR